MPRASKCPTTNATATPLELFIDYDEGMADEETRFVIRGFTLR